MNINECIEQGYLKKIDIDPKLVDKEFNESEYDEERSGKAFEEKDYKWSIVQSYYSMFHSARAVLFKLGYQEKRHFAVTVVLEDLYKKGKLESEFVNYFKAAVSSREDADYHYTYSKETAAHVLEIAKIFNIRMKKIKI